MSGWTHYRTLAGKCPECGAPAHVGVSNRTGRTCWLHDVFPGASEYVRGHHYGHPPKGIGEEELDRILADADARGIEIVGDESAKWKRVKCVETGQTFDSITHAADWAGVSRPSLSVAVKKGTRSGGYHWQAVGE